MLASTVAVALTAVACGSDEPEAAPTPDVAAIIDQALQRAPQGATVQEIQAMVGDSIAAAMAAMPEASPGLTRADVESIVRSASGNQLSAADVKSIVDESIRALPAPEINQSELTGLINSAVAQSVPEGVSAAEIQRIVQSQVTAGLAGSLTRGDVEDLVASAVTNAVGDQLSAADVQNIVDNALVATNAAIEAAAKQAETAAMAADNAAMAADTAANTAADAVKAADSAAMAAEEAIGAVEQIVMEIQTPASCYIRGNRVTDCPAKGSSSYRAAPHTPGIPWLYHSAYDGPLPTKFFESPLSAQLVKEGSLPPLTERLPVPEDVTVVLGPDGIGEYGGAYRITEIRSYTGEWISFGFVQRDSDEIHFGPGAGKSWEASEDGREYTYTLRRGLKWSDGVPLTMEDVRFAFEDHNFNEEINPFVPAQMTDPVTGELAQFSIVDDLNFKIAFDSPNWVLMEQTHTASLCMRNRFCWFGHPNLKKIHPKFAGAEQAQAIADSMDLKDWRDVMHASQNVQLARFELEPFEDIGSTGCVAPYCFVEYKPGELAVAERNHYFPFVDPAGNQLPYTDQVVMIILPGDEATVRFRAMNGEVDGRTTNYILPELPLYIQNMESGDYSIYGWPSLGGADLGFHMNQTYNVDPEIGRLVRTKDFRIAFSHALDRNAINETAQLGLGVIQNRVPHPSTPYNPADDELTQLYMERDLDKANMLLDGIGLNNRDSDGFRTLPNGQRVSITFQYGSGGGRPAIAELMRAQLAEVGIEIVLDENGQWYIPLRSAQGCCTIDTNLSRHTVNPWMRFTTNFVPFDNRYFYPATEIARYYDTAGNEGMAPGTDTNFLPLAPPDNFPADHSGWFRDIHDDVIAGFANSTFDPRRVELGKGMYRNHAENLLAIHVSAFSNAHIGLMLNRNNMRGVPFTHAQDHNGHTAWAYFFDDGQDNYNHPGNRSQYCNSWAFHLGGRQACSN
jgi:peptide/nickel transport system substrate-binding protein